MRGLSEESFRDIARSQGRLSGRGLVTTERIRKRFIRYRDIREGLYVGLLSTGGPVFNTIDAPWLSTAALEGTPLALSWESLQQIIRATTSGGLVPTDARNPTDTLLPSDEPSIGYMNWEAVSSAISVSQTDVLPWEALQALSATSVDPYLTTAPASQSLIDPWEALQAVSQTGTYPWLAGQGILLAVSAPWEALAAIAQSVIAPWESTGTIAVAQSIVLPWETLQALSKALDEPYESVQGMAGLVQVPWESVQALTASSSLPWEAQQVLARALSHPYEAAGFAVQLLALPYETIQPLSVTAAVSWEAVTGGIAKTMQAPWEALLQIAKTVLGPYEAAGFATGLAVLPWDAPQGFVAQVPGVVVVTEGTLYSANGSDGKTQDATAADAGQYSVTISG